MGHGMSKSLRCVHGYAAPVVVRWVEFVCGLRATCNTLAKALPIISAWDPGTAAGWVLPQRLRPEMDSSGRKPFVCDP